MPYSKQNRLPAGWVSTLLGQVAYWSSGGTPSRKKAHYFGGTIPWIKTGELGTRIIRSAKEHITEDAILNSSAKIFPTGSVGIAMYGATIGKLSIWGIDASTNQACAVAQPFSRLLNNKFLYYYLLSERRSLIEAGKGGAQPNISQGIIKGWPLKLPPLNEQVRIVEKLEELFSELDKGIESLKTAREQLKVYRQAALKHAFEGKLTADWRAANPDKLETDEELLARVNAEREACYQQQLKEWEAAVKAWEEAENQGRKPPKPWKPQTSVFSNSQSCESSPWIWTPLRFLASEMVLGKMLDRQKNTGTARPYLGNINVRWGQFDLEHLKLMRFEPHELDRYGLKHGDLIVCEGGEPGRCAIWKGDAGEIFIQKALHRVRFTESYLPEFAYYFMMFATAFGLAEKHYTGTTIKHLTGKGLEQLSFPLCSLNEQAEVVKRIEENLSAVEALEVEIKSGSTKVEALRQSILKKAFSGELVPQDPNDEPASVLLERIRTECGGRKAVKKLRKKRAPA